MNSSFVLLESAARTAEATSVQQNTRFRGGHFIIDVTADPSAASITPHIEGYDIASGSWYTILTGSAIAATGTTILRVYPDLAPSANAIADDVLPFRWRFRMAVADTDSMTYSVGFNGVK